MDPVVIHNSQSPLIHILDDYSLLNIFSLSRPEILDEIETNPLQLIEGGEWKRERWWYRLVQVCRRWRNIVLESASRLRLSLACTRGTPVADMLAHSPTLPLVIDYVDKYHNITAEDEEGIIIALQYRDRVRRIRVKNSVQDLANALVGEFPILESMLIDYQPYPIHTIKESDISHITTNLPDTFRAPHLRHLVLQNFANHIGSQILMTMRNLVTLLLDMTAPSAYFQPNALLQRLSLMPWLETFGVSFHPQRCFRNAEGQILRMPIVTHVTLPKLRWLVYQGTSAYLEVLRPWHFMSTSGNLRLKAATLGFFEDHLRVIGYPTKGAETYSLDMILDGIDLDWQVMSAARVLRALRTEFSAVEHFTLKYDRVAVSMAAEWSNEADRSQWRELLGSFGNAKTLRLEEDYDLVSIISCALRPGKGESPTEVLPELQELSCFSAGALRRNFSSFFDARQKAGCPVAMIYP